jgi:predicted DNA-binding transcriptional regulator AlpA
MLITYKQFYKLFGIPFSRQHILRLQKAGKFPLRRKVGNLNFWTYEEVKRWIDGLWRPLS